MSVERPPCPTEPSPMPFRQHPHQSDSQPPFVVVLGAFAAGFRPRPSPTRGGHEEDRGQRSAGSANGQEKGPGQKARAQEEGRGSAKGGGRPPEGGTRPPEEDRRLRAKGTAAADKPAEEVAKQTEEESRCPGAAGLVRGGVGVRVLRDCVRGGILNLNAGLPHPASRAVSKKASHVQAGVNASSRPPTVTIPTCDQPKAAAATTITNSRPVMA